MLDWLVREGGWVLSWWLLVTLAGAAALPLCARLLGSLPDKGYTLARAAGLLLVGFVFWLLASFGFLRNSAGDMLLAWLIVLALSVFVYRRFGPPVDVKAWWRDNRKAIIAAEVLFALMFVGWSVVRAHQNGLTGTEKPMELMMMSAVQRSDTFPPNDAWMAGYAISYYYFGYIITSMLATLSGINSTTAFNLTAALLFALTGLGVFGVVYNLVRSRTRIPGGGYLQNPSQGIAMVVAVIGVLFVTFMSNFEMLFVEVPYRSNSASADYLSFWSVNDRQEPRTGEASLDPSTWGYWWWWPASRVVSDRTLDNAHSEVIDEFPAFSFVLGDNHPHVLVLPFVLLALGTALSLLLNNRPPTIPEIAFCGLLVGGLFFLNTWDGPIYALALLGAEGLRRALHTDWRLRRQDWTALLFFGVEIAVLAFFLYLPFWLGFRSQAGGLLPNVINPTRTPQFFLMFGPFILLLLPFLFIEAWRAGPRFHVRAGLMAAVGILVVLILVFAVLIAVGSLIPSLRGEAQRLIEEAGGMDAFLPIFLNRRAEAILTTLGLLLAIFLVAGRLIPRRVGKAHDDVPEDRFSYPPATGFALLLIGMGLVLALTPEFVYLRDNFGSRMNTIFKFYYQAWILFSIAGAYAVYTLVADDRLPIPSSVLRPAYSVVAILVLGTGLFYPLAATYHRTMIETGRQGSLDTNPLTLDGVRTFASASDLEAIACLNQLAPGDDWVAVEAIGPAYRAEYGRVAALTGIPILLGWVNHEGQWRGPTYSAAAGSREADVERLYTDPRWEVAQGIINTYGIDYIFYGESERRDYGLDGEIKFQENLEPVCERGSSLFYRVNPVQVAGLP